MEQASCALWYEDAYVRAELVGAKFGTITHECKSGLFYGYIIFLHRFHEHVHKVLLCQDFLHTRTQALDDSCEQIERGCHCVELHFLHVLRVGLVLLRRDAELINDQSTAFHDDVAKRQENLTKVLSYGREAAEKWDDPFICRPYALQPGK
jgi:hypothetical protein